MRVNDAFKLSTAATEIALNNSRLVENPENFGGQNWLLRLATRHDYDGRLPKGLFTRREGYPCATVTLASGLKLALVYKHILQVALPYHLGQLYQCYFVMRDISCNGPKFEIIF